ncbi:NAD(P)-dependent oxidoreductase [Gulosibacter sediminis]|uniref:NAD(P)-dependent oxidoreductase n=1 Tax=Gulosibacter sediminis TaxID=1729695 RepID=UPI0024AE6CE4|nr:NAD(P)-dependent oxidoreductase [Gulosibacter sediminis]
MTQHVTLTANESQGVASIGLVGLGNMGYAVCQRLGAGSDVVAYDISKERRQLASALERVTATERLEDLAGAETIVLSLPRPEISLSVLAQVSEVVRPGTVVIETSTVTPDAVESMKAIADAAELLLIDAAILSGTVDMAEHRSKLLVGGDRAAIDRAAGVLDLLSPKWIEFGASGSGMAAKVINNGVAHATMVVLLEAFAIARSYDVDPGLLVNLLKGEDAGLIRPLTFRIDQRVAGGDYKGGMSVASARKDSELIVDMAKAAKVPLFATSASHSVYELALGMGLGGLDYAAIANLWEQGLPGTLQFSKDEGWAPAEEELP